MVVSPIAFLAAARLDGCRTAVYIPSGPVGTCLAVSLPFVVLIECVAFSVAADTSILSGLLRPEMTCDAAANEM